MIATAIISILAPILMKAGAPILKRVLDTEVGGVAGEAGSVVIDSIGAALGVPPTVEAIVEAHDKDPDGTEAAIRTVEKDRDWIMYLTAATAARDRMLEREDTRESAFSWAWRPAMSWLVGFLFLWSMVLVPVVNAALNAAVVPPSTNDILQFAGIWLVIYGGGHTAKELWGAK